MERYKTSPRSAAAPAEDSVRTVVSIEDSSGAHWCPRPGGAADRAAPPGVSEDCEDRVAPPGGP